MLYSLNVGSDGTKDLFSFRLVDGKDTPQPNPY